MSIHCGRIQWSQALFCCKTRSLHLKRQVIQSCCRKRVAIASWLRFSNLEEQCMTLTCVSRKHRWALWWLWDGCVPGSQWTGDCSETSSSHGSSRFPFLGSSALPSWLSSNMLFCEAPPPRSSLNCLQVTDKCSRKVSVDDNCYFEQWNVEEAVGPNRTVHKSVILQCKFVKTVTVLKNPKHFILTEWANSSTMFCIFDCNKMLDKRNHICCGLLSSDLFKPQTLHHSMYSFLKCSSDLTHADINHSYSIFWLKNSITVAAYKQVTWSLSPPCGHLLFLASVIVILFGNLLELIWCM